MLRNLLFLLILIRTSVSCQPTNPQGETYDPPNSTDTRTKQIEYQEKKTYQIDDIFISNEFSGARLNNAYYGGKDTIITVIKPENAPINKSAWFSFQIWSETSKRVTIKLTYQDGEHRYIPKISRNGFIWNNAPKSNFHRDKENKKFAWLIVDIGEKPTWISAQELMTSEEIFNWMDKWADKKDFVSTKKIGESRLEAPMRLMEIKETNEKNMLLLIGRQHPPEITGQIAMHTFTETVMGDSDLAKNFRKKFQIYVFPLMNPDGVDNGHWRHSPGGIDLNRDWHKFRQPEVKAVTKFLTKEVKRKKLKVWYGFDFHSTGADVLYPITEDIITKDNSITYPWIESMKERIPDDPWLIEPFDISSPICKNWIFRTFGAEAITYEVGDEVGRSYVQLKARVAAEEMMRLLLIKIVEETNQ